MQELYFIATLLLTLFLVITILLKIIRKKPVYQSLKTLSFIIIIYMLVWVISYSTRAIKPVNFVEDICFDDWCATISSFERLTNIDNRKADGQFFILTVKMTNKAKGISQKPSEPSIHIMDNLGHIWAFSTVGQKAYESLQGVQIPIDQRLELNQSLQTKIVFDIPKDAAGLKAVIEEGPPFINNLILQTDKKVFELR